MDEDDEYDGRRAATAWLEIPAAGLVLLGLGALFTYWPLGAAMSIVGLLMFVGSRLTKS